MILDLYVQMVLHSAVSALGVEALLVLWSVREPAQRWRYRLLALLLPVLTVPAFRLLDPSWGSPAFRAGEALFDSRRWLELRVGGVTGRVAVMAVFATSTLGFFLQEVRPLIRELWQEKSPRRAPAEFPDLASALASWRNISPGESPAIEIIDAEEPMSKCKGGKHAAVVLSSGLLNRVDKKELLSILAHEGAHLRKRDHQYGWALLFLRILHAANPIGLLVFRKLGEENENWCDDLSVAATGDPLSLASALVHVYRGTLTNDQHSLEWYRSGGRALGARAREAVIVARIERLMKPRPAGSSRQLEPWRMGVAGVSLTTLLFRVV
ncbi:MAG: M56 family metallopeptidase [Candidatus Tectomicrobia bacterium]|uniref:M56 family metallopeptidase n=1 Tax=Tectimicrobiota bacterium TaxID=2528274 RepID=A0A932M0Q4_UNCTE|nr:M56 family metallopeptidase [Candidatus Tectomicrobia bacterium]